MVNKINHGHAAMSRCAGLGYGVAVNERTTPPAQGVHFIAGDAYHSGIFSCVYAIPLQEFG